MNLKKLLIEDVWKIIEGEELPRVKDKFLILVLQLLLESTGFKMGDAYQISKKIEERYDRILDDIDNYLLDPNGDLLSVLKNISKDYGNKIEPLLNKIKNIGEKNFR